jgi:hypothetical protein
MTYNAIHDFVAWQSNPQANVLIDTEAVTQPS